LYPPLADEKIKQWTEWIDNASHIDLARLYRFAPIRHPLFGNAALAEKFAARFKKLGGMTKELSIQLSGY
jgi:hypothetical protein